MEHPLDKTLHLDMVPRTSKTLYVKDEFVISDNLSIRVPPGIAALLEKGRPTRTLRPNWLEFPYRIGFNAILFVETGVVDCILNTETFRITNRSVLLIPSATLLRDLSWQAGTRYILFGYNDDFPLRENPQGVDDRPLRPDHGPGADGPLHASDQGPHPRGERRSGL